MPDVGTQRLGRSRDAGQQPAAGQRHCNGPGLRHLVQNLQPEGALPRDDVGVIERRDQGEALLGLKPLRLEESLVLAGADHPGFGAKRADRVQLVLRHQARDADDRPQALGPRRMGQRAAVVAGRGGGDPRASPSRATALVAPRSLKAPVC